MEFADIIRISRVDNVRLRRPAEPHAEVQIQDTEILVLYLIWKYWYLESVDFGHICTEIAHISLRVWSNAKGFLHSAKIIKLPLTHTKGDRCCHWAPLDPLVGGGAGKTGSKRNLATPQECTGGAPLLTQRVLKFTILKKAIGRGEESGGRSGTISLRCALVKLFNLRLRSKV